MVERLRSKRTKKTVGGRIAIARATADVTQGELAVHLGRTLSTVQRYESDEIAPSLETAVAIARFLGARIEWIADRQGAGPR
jgi:DNA-binding XRE family transcriptional regulator